MPGIKRPLDEDVTAGEDVQPSRKPRLEFGESQAELAKIFGNLRDEIPAVRLEATRDLLKNLTSKSDDRKARLDYAITRLIKGLCSGAKAARPGFSIALVEVLRIAAKGEAKLSVVDLIDKAVALTNPEGKASGDEKRQYLLGRRFSFQAVLQSGILENAAESDLNHAFDAIAELAQQKDWLRSECGAMLYEFLRSPHAQGAHVRPLVDSWVSKGIVKSPEGVAIWITAKKQFPQMKLPKGHWHHNNPLSSQERVTLTKILLKNAIEASDDEPSTGGKKNKASGARQATPSFAWNVILAYLYEKDDGKDLAQFWEECVAKPMFSSSSSTERKSLGLQIFTKALSGVPAEHLGDIVHATIVRCVIDQRAKSDRYLFEAAKLPLNQMVARSKNDAEAAAEIVTKLLEVVPANLDKLTRSTIDTLLAAADADGLVHIVKVLNDLCLAPRGEDTSEAEKKRRMLADVLLTLVRTRRSDPTQFFQKGDTPVQWLKVLLGTLTDLGYLSAISGTSPVMSAQSQTVFRERLLSALGHLVDLPLKQAIQAPVIVTDKLHSLRKNIALELDDTSKDAVKNARKALKDAEEKAIGSKEPKATVARAFQLLLALGILQVYKQEPDSAGVLEDITSCYRSPQGSEDSSTMLVELLLSFISKQSVLFRKLAEQVFSAFAPDVTTEGLQSMIDILSRKESLAGQQELFKDADGEDDAESGADEDDSDVEMEDVEDASDGEIVNGEVVGEDDSDDDSSDSSSDDNSDAEEAGDDEEAEFDRKLADALGTVGMEANSDDDGSEMDDDQMMALEPHLNNIFKERKKGTSKRQDNKDARENIINFKNRVLDLLLVYVKSQYSNPIAMNLIHPITTLTRETTSQPTAKKALDTLETYFDTCKKHKTSPQLADSDAVFQVLTAVHTEMRLGGSKIHASACSRSSQFIAKILVSMDPENWKKVGEMYVGLQHEWRQDAKSKIHGSIFNDWHSWSMQR